MTNVELVEHLLGILDEAVFPALAVWLAYYLRRWMAVTLKVDLPPRTRKEPS